MSKILRTVFIQVIKELPDAVPKNRLALTPERDRSHPNATVMPERELMTFTRRRYNYFSGGYVYTLTILNSHRMWDYRDFHFGNENVDVKQIKSKYKHDRTITATSECLA